jgi:MFS family permease
LNGLTVVFLQFPAVRITRRLRLTTSLTLGAVLYGLGYGMMGFGQGMALLLAATLLVSLGEIISTPPSLQLVANFSGVTTRGRYMGLFGVFNSIGWSLGPVVGGALLDAGKGRPMLVWSVIMALAFVAAAGFLDLRRRLQPSLDRDLETAHHWSAVA